MNALTPGVDGELRMPLADGYNFVRVFVFVPDGGRLGMGLDDDYSVTALEPGGACERAGVKVDDQVVEANGASVFNNSEPIAALLAPKDGKIVLGLRRPPPDDMTTLGTLGFDFVVRADGTLSTPAAPPATSAADESSPPAEEPPATRTPAPAEGLGSPVVSVSSPAFPEPPKSTPRSTPSSAGAKSSTPRSTPKSAPLPTPPPPPPLPPVQTSARAAAPEAAPDEERRPSSVRELQQRFGGAGAWSSKSPPLETSKRPSPGRGGAARREQADFFERLAKDDKFDRGPAYTTRAAAEKRGALHPPGQPRAAAAPARATTGAKEEREEEPPPHGLASLLGAWLRCCCCCCFDTAAAAAQHDAQLLI